MLPKVLIAAGNYRITDNIIRALEGLNIVIKCAYSHRDTMYMLDRETTSFQIVIIDAAMFDRYSGKYTFDTLYYEQHPSMRAAIALSGADQERIRELPGDKSAIITELDEETIAQVISTLLGRTTPHRMSRTPSPTEEILMPDRGDEIDLIFDISQSLTEVLELEEVLTRVVEAARNLTNAEESVILLPENGVLYVRAKIGMDSDAASRFRIKSDDSIPLEVFNTGKASLFGTTEEEKRRKIKTQLLVYSLLYVPLIYKGKTIGVMGVHNILQREAFNLGHQNTLMRLASFAAIAIDNARSHEETLKRTLELEKLVNATQVMSESLELENTLINVCEQIGQLIEASIVEVFQLTDNNTKLQKRANYLSNVGRPLAGGVRSLSPKKREHFAQSKVYWEDDDGMKVMNIPVTSAGEQFGAIRAFYYKSPSTVPENYVIEAVRELGLETLGALFKTFEEERLNARKQVMTHVGRIREILRCAWCEAANISQNGMALYREVQVGSRYWGEPPFPEIVIRDEPIFDHVMADGELIEINDVQSKLIAPIKHRAGTWGFVVITDFDNQRRFTDQNKSLAQALSSQASRVIENAELYVQLQRSMKEKEDAQSRMLQAVRYSTMGELAGVVAHQINNPLTTVIADSELLLLYTEKDSPQYKSLTAINSAGQRASSVANRLLTVVRTMNPDNNDPYAPLSILDSINGTLELVGTNIERRGIKIKCIFAKELPKIMALPGLLDDVWLNLLMNAQDAIIEYSGSTIEIRVHHDRTDNKVVIQIIDDGPGMTEEVRQQIFDLYFTTKPPGAGTGLGLHICKELVEKVGGTIACQSKQGSGTRFIIALPAVDETVSIALEENK